MHVRMRPTTLAWFITLGAVWGGAFVFISLGLQRFSPILLAALRFDLASLILVPIVLWRREPLWPRGARQWIALFVASGLGIVFYNLLLMTGQQHTSASIAGVIVSLNPLLTLIVARAILPEEHVGLTGILGLLVGLLGVGFLASLKPGPLFDAAGLGELAIGVAILCWSISSTTIRVTRHGMPVFSFVALQCVLGAIILHAAGLLLEPEPRAEWDLVGVVSLLMIGAFAVAVGYVLFFHIMDEVGAVRVNLVSYLSPVFATIGSLVILHEEFQFRALVAFVLIALGFSLVAYRGPTRRPLSEAVPK